MLKHCLERRCCVKIGGAVNHLKQDFLCILQALVERRILKFDVRVCYRHGFEFSLCVDKSNNTTAAAQDELRLILEHNLNDTIVVAQQYCFASSLPLLDVSQRELKSGSDRCSFLCKWELEWLKLLVSI
jgi:hypothetical protein